MELKLQEEQKPKKSLSATEQKLLDELQYPESPRVVRNPFSGVEVLLPPKGVALLEYIKGYESLIHQQRTKNIRQFDMARYLFNKLFPDAYMDLLD